MEDEDNTIQCTLYYTLYYDKSGYTCTIAIRQTIQFNVDFGKDKKKYIRNELLSLFSLHVFSKVKLVFKQISSKHFIKCLHNDTVQRVHVFI